MSHETTGTQRILDMVNSHGDILSLEDGFFYFWAKGRGAFSANNLRVIADEIDRRNQPLKEMMEKDPCFAANPAAKNPAVPGLNHSSTSPTD